MCLWTVQQMVAHQMSLHDGCTSCVALAGHQAVRQRTARTVAQTKRLTSRTLSPSIADAVGCDPTVTVRWQATDACAAAAAAKLARECQLLRLYWSERQVSKASTASRSER